MRKGLPQFSQTLGHALFRSLQDFLRALGELLDHASQIAIQGRLQKLVPLALRDGHLRFQPLPPFTGSTIANLEIRLGRLRRPRCTSGVHGFQLQQRLRHLHGRFPSRATFRTQGVRLFRYLVHQLAHLREL